MTNIIKNLSISLIILALANCSKPQFISLPEELKDDIKSSEAHYEQAQHKIYALVESTNISALSSGLLFVIAESIADSVKKNNVDKSLEPIQTFYKQQDVDVKLKTAIHAALKNTPWLHLTKLSMATSLESNNLEAIITNTTADVAVIVEADLKLNPRFDVLSGTLFLTVVPASAKLKTKLGIKEAKDALEKPIYKTKVMATFELPHFTEDIDENATKWTENDGKLFLDGLDKVIRSLGVQLENALRNPHTTME
jgi:hypothetical protein